MAVKDEVGRMQEEVGMAYFNVIYPNSAGGPAESSKTVDGQPAEGIRTAHVYFRNANVAALLTRSGNFNRKIGYIPFIWV
jgi:hypothetical protein